jgi:hypothetical protein
LSAQSLNTRGPDATLVSGIDIAASDQHIEALTRGKAQFRRSRAIRLAASASAELPTVAAQALLAAVLGRLSGKRPHLLQFLSFEDGPAVDITRAFCVAAAERVGRVLQAEFLPDALVAGGDRIVPDSAIARLYHGCISLCSLDVVRHGRSALLQAVDADPDDYDMVVADIRYTNGSLENSNLSSAFNGTILVVRAGMTTLSEVRTAVSAVQHAGGLVLGAVLADVPPKPSWLRGLGAR